MGAWAPISLPTVGSNSGVRGLVLLLKLLGAIPACGTGFAPNCGSNFGGLAEGLDEVGEGFAEVGEQRVAGEAQGAVVEHRVGRAGRGTGGVRSAVVIGSTRAGSAPAARSTSRANSNQLTAPWFVTCTIPGRRSTTNIAQHRREVGGEGRAAALVVDEAQRPVAAGQPQDRLGHVGAVAAARPTTCARPRDSRSISSSPAKLRLSVHGGGVRRVPLVIRLGLACRRRRSRSTASPRTRRPGGRLLDERARPSAFTRNARSGSRLARVDRGHRRAVHDRVGCRRRDRGQDGVAVADIERGVIGGDHVVRPRTSRRPRARPCRPRR